MQTELPIGEVLEALRDALLERNEAVLEAPPGAGKTTVVPLALMDSDWLGGQKILLLEPRRMAARAAAERMAATLGESAGETVGYRVRLETRVSRNTRIEVITEGILTRMLQSDPALEGIGLLIFDEFHERSLDSDLGLALALQGRELFREGLPLKILVMSATLDGAAVAALLGDAPVIASRGKQYPVAIEYSAPWRARENTGQRVAAALAEVLTRPDTGSVLAFLPGQAEILRTADALGSEGGVINASGSEGEVIIAPLYGGLSLAEQQRAIEPAPAGARKVVLATNIAETSLTIEGITTVVDSGLAREPAYDPNTGMTRLQTRRIARDNATQRAGRAGRLGPGHCLRLWSEEQQQQLAPRATPEILQADLTSLVLQLLAWGVCEPSELRWLDAPPGAPWNQALELLTRFTAVSPTDSGGWRLTEDGEYMAGLPMHPRLAHMVLCGARWGALERACELAARITERGGRVRQQAKQFARLCRDLPQGAPTEVEAGVLLAMAYPDRIARRRQARGNVYQLSNGRSAELDRSDALCNREWLVVSDVGGRVGHEQDRIYSAEALSPEAFDEVLAPLVSEQEVAEWDESGGRFVARLERRVGALLLSAEKLAQVPAEVRLQALLDLLRRRGLGLLPWNDAQRQWQARVQLLHTELGAAWPDVSDAALLRGLEHWLAPFLGSVNSLADLARLDLKSILATLLPWPLPKELDELAPQRIVVPSGSSVAIDYTVSPPVLAVKLQEMFGCDSTPTVANGKVALLVHLLSPARRPLQVTQDLASFWASGYSEVRKEMQGRYPRHPWPEDPRQAPATAKTKRHLSKQGDSL